MQTMAGKLKQKVELNDIASYTWEMVVSFTTKQISQTSVGKFTHCRKICTIPHRMYCKCKKKNV